MRLYYTAPEDEYFNDLKEKAIELWSTYDDEFGYASEKISRIKFIANVRDNFMYIVAMFDLPNQRKLAEMISPETRSEVRRRMVDGGQPDIYNPF